MEQKIEGAIDSGLESLSSGLYVFSVGFGIVLIILGAILLFKSKDRGSNKKKGAVNIGLISLVLGVVAVISGLVQMSLCSLAYFSE